MEQLISINAISINSSEKEKLEFLEGLFENEIVKLLEARLMVLQLPSRSEDLGKLFCDESTAATVDLGDYERLCYFLLAEEPECVAAAVKVFVNYLDESSVDPMIRIGKARLLQRLSRHIRFLSQKESPFTDELQAWGESIKQELKIGSFGPINLIKRGLVNAVRKVKGEFIKTEGAGRDFPFLHTVDQLLLVKNSEYNARTTYEYLLPIVNEKKDFQEFVDRCSRLRESDCYYSKLDDCLERSYGEVLKKTYEEVYVYFDSLDSVSDIIGRFFRRSNLENQMAVWELVQMAFEDFATNCVNNPKSPYRG